MRARPWTVRRRIADRVLSRYFPGRHHPVWAGVITTNNFEGFQK